MPAKKKVKDVMIPLEDYPHIPHWFTLRQAMAIVWEASLKSGGSYLPRSVLVFDENKKLMGIITLRDIIKGLEPKFLQESTVAKVEAALTVLLEQLFAPEIKELANRPVSEVMGPVEFTVAADDPLTRALAIMLMEHVGMMPVIQEDTVVGMIRLSDIFRVISQAVLEE
jgi:CBS domain-containing protein